MTMTMIMKLDMVDMKNICALGFKPNKPVNARVFLSLGQNGETTTVSLRERFEGRNGAFDTRG